MTRENFGELEDLIDLARSLGASRFCLYWLVPSGRGSDSYSRIQLGREEVTEALSLLYRKAQETDPGTMEFLTVESPQDCVHPIQSMERDGSPDLADARNLLKSLKGECSAGDRAANVDPLGNVSPCQFSHSLDFFIGNIRKRPFSALWTDSAHPVLARFREKPVHIGRKCGKCGYFEICGGGCRVRAYAKAGNFFSEDPFCFVDPDNSSL
ncbi:MAG: SPASM domain-containing protein [Methanoregula sp.]|nr:SPASM domain-containing protein [Methanoregula sp.]